MASSDDRGNERAGGGDAEQEERTDGWMATYADMVTLLLTFFVLMFALSNVDNEKAQMFLYAMSRDGLTAEQFLEIQARYDLDDRVSEWDDDTFPIPPAGNPEDEPGEEEGPSAGDLALAALAEAMEGWVEDKGFGNIIEVVFNGEYLMLTLNSDVLFDPGYAVLTPDMVEHGTALAQMMADTFTISHPFEIVVAGHTDNVPMTSGRYPDNWHLSNARATNFLLLLMYESGIEPQHFTTRSCGEYKPIASNDTEEGRQKNRRVEVMISLARENPLWDGTVSP